MAKNPLTLKHVQSVRVVVLQDLNTNDIVGKIIANYSDNGVCTTQAFIYGGKFADADLAPTSCGGSGYDKFNSCLCAIFGNLFETYKEVSDLDAGLISKWFEQHGYKATSLI